MSVDFFAIFRKNSDVVPKYNNNNYSIIYFNVLTQQLQEPITEAAQEDKTKNKERDTIKNKNKAELACKKFLVSRKCPQRILFAKNVEKICLCHLQQL
jgi:hypothetical protein